MLRRNIDNIEIQLDHYGYAAEFSERIDALGFRLEAVQEAQSIWDDALETVRYGLIEFGGFVRFSTLTVAQRLSVLTQERSISRFGMRKETNLILPILRMEKVAKGGNHLRMMKRLLLGRVFTPCCMTRGLGEMQLTSRAQSLL